MGNNKKMYLLLSVLLLCLTPVIAFYAKAEVNGGYTYEVMDGTATITQYVGKETEVVIPSAFDGIPVTKIGPSVFNGKKSITKIILPEGLTDIGTLALRGTGITEIALPASLNAIGDYAFQFCKSLQTISVPDTNKAFTSLDGVLYSKDLSELVAYPIGKTADRFVIPNSVKNIAKGAFYLCSLTEIILPEGIERITNEAFLACIKLQQIDIPSSVFVIGNSAFDGCDGLKTVILPQGVTQISERAFASCDELETVILPEGVTIIGKQAFYDSGLAAIDLPGSLTEIGESAFESCDELLHILIPSSVTSIGYKALNNCGQLQSIQVEAQSDTYSSLDGVLYNKAQTTLISYPIGKGEDRYVIPDSVSVIEDYAFYSSFLYEIAIPEGVTHIGRSAFCSMLLTSLIIPQSVISIGEFALNGCDNLESIGVATDNQAYTCVDGVLYDKAMTELIVYPAQKADTSNFIVPDTVKRLGVDAFMSNAALISITLPQGLESIGADAFFNCTELTGLTIPVGVTSIGKVAFGQCKSMKAIALPDGMKAIPDYAFINCSSLKTVYIPDSVTSIGINTFYACKSLESVLVPDAVTTIRNYAFANCTELYSITIPSSVTNIGTHVFDECPQLTIYGVPGSTAQTYAETNGIPFKAI